MKMLTLLSGLAAAATTAAIAADDPIATRQALMSSNGASAAVAGGVMKGELDYNPVTGKSVIVSLHATAMAFGDYFPEGSSEGETDAAPAIWEDRAGFEAELTKFREATAAALEAAGKDGPADAAAFQAAMGPIFDTCKSCHENYRLED